MHSKHRPQIDVPKNVYPKDFLPLLKQFDAVGIYPSMRNKNPNESTFYYKLYNLLSGKSLKEFAAKNPKEVEEIRRIHSKYNSKAKLKKRGVTDATDNTKPASKRRRISARPTVNKFQNSSLEEDYTNPALAYAQGKWKNTSPSR